MLLKKILFPILILLMLTLSSCYLPTNYWLETTIDKNGEYKMRFRGYLVSLPYYKKLRNKEFKSNEEHLTFHKREMKELYNNDPYMKRMIYAKNGYFWIDWSVKDNILKHHYVAVINRNNRFATLGYYLNKNITKFTMNSLSYKQLLKLKQAGIVMQGKVIIKTNAKVLEQNAMKITKGKDNWVTYEWVQHQLEDSPPKDPKSDPPKKIEPKKIKETPTPFIIFDIKK